ncbi:hypothetical protein Ga0466249_000417 [Sporomusaceae bacterium BoRhaA]|uniref:hypothetical protein n=1 Tax=Pelorhabdus rhamnosifermentans TaxID=2772457 RepID=UPI001C062839|nr:hypothetical protein [Pelorhabdus rhamnosifermentans]MBU2699338.1 hypothetical protein [Pelorhabdus rhamnosifermentans]
MVLHILGTAGQLVELIKQLRVKRNKEDSPTVSAYLKKSGKLRIYGFLLFVLCFKGIFWADVQNVIILKYAGRLLA